MADREACIEAKKRGSLGTILSVIGHITIGILLLLVIIMFFAPISIAIAIMDFLAVFGWILGIIALILIIIGKVMKRKVMPACSIV